MLPARPAAIGQFETAAVAYREDETGFSASWQGFTNGR